MTITNEAFILRKIMGALRAYGAVYRTNAGLVKLPDGNVYRGLQKLELQVRAAGLNVGSDRYGEIVILDSANRELTGPLTISEARSWIAQIMRGE